MRAPGHSSKLLVTRRSWLLDSTWAKVSIPTRRSEESDGLRRSSAVPLRLGDYVDSGTTSLVPRAGTTGGELYELASKTTGTSDSEVGLKEFIRVHGFRPYQLILFVFSALAYISDVGSDCYLAFSYYRQGHFYWSALTLALFLIPALIMTAFSLVWYVLDRKINVDPPRTCRAWFLRLFFHGLQLAPLVRLADAMYYGIESRRAGVSLAMAVHYTQLMLYEDADSAMLRMMECFMEAAPQLLLQLYIIFTQATSEYSFQSAAQIVSCFTSWASLAWSLTHYQSALRSSRAEKANLNWCGSVLFFSWKAGMLASRILALSLLAVLARGLIFALVVGLHWIVAVGWLIVRGTTFCSPRPHTIAELLFDAILGAVYCFDVVNVREGHSRLWYLSCYTVIGLENLVLVIAWSQFALRTEQTPRLSRWTWWARRPQLSPWVRTMPGWILPLAVIGSFLIGLAMMLTYYLFAHPSGKIKLWVPCDVLLRCDSSESVESNHVTELGMGPISPSAHVVVAKENSCQAIRI